MTIDDAEALNAMRLAKWYLATNKRLRFRAMRCGGFAEVISFAMINVLSYANPDKLKLSTIVINSVRFALARLDEKVRKLERFSYEKVDLDIIQDYRWNLTDILDSLFQSECRDALTKTLGLLKVRQREAIELCFFGGMTNKEAAEVMGCSGERVRQLLLSGIRELQQPNASKKLVSHLCDSSFHATDAMDDNFEKQCKMTLRQFLNAGLLRRLA